jgi:hypothetical protein
LDARMTLSKWCKWTGQSAWIHEDPWERRGGRTGPRWAWVGRPMPAGLAHSRGRFGLPFLAPEDHSTLSCWRRHHSQKQGAIRPGGLPQAREKRRGSFARRISYSKEAPASGGEVEDRSVRGPVDGRFWLWWVIDNMGWTDSWPSIASAGCGLICVGQGEEWARKVYALRGLRGVERQVGLTRGTRWPVGLSAGRMVARKARRSCRLEPV